MISTGDGDFASGTDDASICLDDDDVIIMSLINGENVC